MSCRLPIACLLLSLSACKQVADVGGEALAGPGCLTECLDASTASDAGWVRPGPSVPSVDAAVFGAFNAQLDGLWYGISKDLSRGEDAPVSRFEIRFSMQSGAAGVGTFLVQCLDEPECDPFGNYSAGPAGGTVEILDLELRSTPAAQGKLRWSTPFGGSGEMPFWGMQRVDRDSGAVLTFDGGFPGAAPYSSAVFDVVLVEGAWPDAATPMLDAGPRDAAADSGHDAQGLASDAGATRDGMAP